MIETYGNDVSFHQVLKIEVKKGVCDGVREVIIHQLVETNREVAKTYGGKAVDSDGRFIMQHKVTCFLHHEGGLCTTPHDDPIALAVHEDPITVEVS